MASVVQQKHVFTVRFRFAGKYQRITVGESRFEAERLRQNVELLLSEIRIGRIHCESMKQLRNLLQPESFSSASSAASRDRMPCRKPLFASIREWKTSHGCSEATIRLYEIHAKHLESFFGDTELSQLDIQSYVDHRSQFVKAKTIKKELITLSSVLKWSNESGIDFKRLRFPVNPSAAPFTRLENAVDGRKVLLPRKEVEQLCETVRKHGSEMIADAITFVAYTAARRSEVTRLHRRDIDFDRRFVTITELKRKHGHVTYRTIPIHEKLFPILEKRKEADPVFTSSVDSLTSGLKEAIKGTKFEIKGFGYHVLRHSAATQLINSGNSIPVVSKLLGHANVATTLNVYSHAVDRDLENVVAKL